MAKKKRHPDPNWRYRPRYCPLCGREGLAAAGGVRPDGMSMYDCYCSSCGWVGDIDQGTMSPTVAGRDPRKYGT